MTCLITISETKKTSAFQFFLEYYCNNSSGKLIAAVLKPITWKSRNYWNLLHCYVLYEKRISTRRKQPLRGASRKQVILNCKNVKTDKLQLENPWKISMRNFEETAGLLRRGSIGQISRKKSESSEVKKLMPRAVLQNSCSQYF